MSSLFFRPVVTYPTWSTAPALFGRPGRPGPVAHDVAPLFSFLDDTLTQLDHHMRQAQSQFKRPFNPKFDVKETKGAYSVEGELPGFDAKDISIEFLDDGHTLQIQGKTVKETKREHTPTKAVEGSTSEPAKAISAPATETPSESAQAATSETSSHHASVEDEPASSSAVEATPEPTKAVEQQKSDEESETKDWISERYTGSFTRLFSFPSKVDQEAVKASLKDGILAITLPFARKSEGGRKIQIE